MPRTYVRRDGVRRRRPPGTRYRVPVPKWVDPMWFIQGSSIEKMVMAEFIRRGIYFEHTPQKNPLPWFPWMIDMKHPENWEPDFLLPQYKIWIEIQGAYFHTLPGQVETDAMRFAFIQTVGWRPIAWWEDDIRTRLPELMDRVPEFYFIDKQKNAKLIAKNSSRDLGVSFKEGGTGIDHLKGLRTALRNRARPPQGIAKRYSRKRRPK